jgi:hypothetical protein
MMDQSETHIRSEIMFSTLFSARLCSEVPRLAGWALPYTEVKELPRSSFLGASSGGRAGGVFED